MKNTLLLLSILFVNSARASDADILRAAFLAQLTPAQHAQLAKFQRDKKILVESNARVPSIPTKTFPRPPAEVAALRKERKASSLPEEPTEDSRREELIRRVADLTSKPRPIFFDGSTRGRLTVVLQGLSRELVFLRTDTHETAMASNNQFCPVHGNIDASDELHHCIAQKPHIKISLKKITNKKQLTDWIAAAPNDRVKSQRTVMGEILILFEFEQKTKELLESIFEYTWTCHHSSEAH